MGLYFRKLLPIGKGAARLLFLILLAACETQNPPTMPQHTNALINESSPYLLQHAHNPVDWLPWGEEAFAQANGQKRLMIISIGYSSCHWCHVMEHESFEDSAVAALMNEHFVAVKVDREERPDVDQVYMTALQLMTGQGGWPLNVVTLPDGRPIWGATYVPREKWMEVLQQLQAIYEKDPAKMEEYATRLTNGIQQAELVEVNEAQPDFSREDADSLFQNWKVNFDTAEGGPNRAPKFPLPNNYEFLLQYGQLTGNNEALQQVQLSLKKMAMGGIYDQVGGGFARYSTDGLWVVPHFEKMLYDNSQLVSLYSKAYQKFKEPLYALTVKQSLEWLEREMTGPDGEFYSALDADSEGEEGKFYVWSEEELQQIIPSEDWESFTEYYNLKKGSWEGKIILVRSGSDAPRKQVERWQKLLLEKRSERHRPGLDDKSLTSWNAMMITGLVDAYLAFAASDHSAAEYLQRAERNAQWLISNQSLADGSLYHSYKAGSSSIEGLIEDYAFATQAFLKLFEATAKEDYLQQAARWMQYAEENFRDSSTGLFYTRSLAGEQLIAKSLERVDNVIPAANSVMARNLYRLGFYLDKSEYREQALNMLHQVDKERMLEYGDNYSNWGQLLLSLTWPHYEVAIAGDQAKRKFLDFQDHYLPNALYIWSESESTLPLLENRLPEEGTRIYVCQDKTCQLPVKEVDKALQQMR